MNDTSHRRLARRLLPAAMGLALFAGACVDTVSTRPVLVTQPAVSTQPRVVAPLPDVSVRKCVDDGFDLVAIYNASGVPERYVCVDRHSGRKCESWAYYRGECVLGAQWNTIPGSSVAPPPDVSVRKCVDDGFDLVAIYNASGVPERYVCVDRHSGRKCESWAYYRGECVLGAQWNTIPGSSPAPRKSATGYLSNCGSHEQSGETKHYNQSVTGGGCPSAVPSHGSSTGSPGLKSDNAGG